MKRARLLWVGTFTLSAGIGLNGFLGACHQPASVGTDTPDVLIVSVDGSQLLAIEPASATIAARPGPIPLWPAARAADGNSVIYSGSTGLYAERELAALDSRTFTITSRWRLAALESTSLVQDIELPSLTSVAYTVDQSRLLLSPSRRSSIEGVAVFDMASGRIVTFVDSLPIAPQGLVSVPPTADLPSGVVVAAVGRRLPAGQTEGWLHLLHPSNLSPFDSVRVSLPVDQQNAGISSVTRTEDGKYLYVVRGNRLLRISLSQRVITDSLSVPSFARILIAPGDTAVFVSDIGDGRNYAGSGVILVASPDLRRIDSLSVRHSAVANAGPTVQAVVVSRNGKYLYVLVGNERIGPLFPAQALKILVIDAGSRALLKSLDLNEWAGGAMVRR